MEQYDGQVERKTIKETASKQINFKALCIWYAGVIISFFPVFIDVLVCMANNNGDVTIEYWISACIHGDILWIIATVLVLSVFDHLTDVKEKNIGLLIMGITLWGLVFAIWAVFKYIFPSTFTNLFPLILTVVLVIASLVISTGLQLKTLEG